MRYDFINNIVLLLAVILFANDSRAQVNHLSNLLTESFDHQDEVGFPSSQLGALTWEDLWEQSFGSESMNVRASSMPEGVSISDNYFSAITYRTGSEYVIRDVQYLMDNPKLIHLVMEGLTDYGFTCGNGYFESLLKKIEDQGNTAFTRSLGRSLDFSWLDSSRVGRCSEILFYAEKFLEWRREVDTTDPKAMVKEYRNSYNFDRFIKDNNIKGKEVPAILAASEELYSIIFDAFHEDDLLKQALQLELISTWTGVLARDSREKESLKTFWNQVAKEKKAWPITLWALSAVDLVDESYVDRDSVWAWINRKVDIIEPEEIILDEKSIGALVEQVNNFEKFVNPWVSTSFDEDEVSYFIRDEEYPFSPSFYELLRRYLNLPEITFGDGKSKEEIRKLKDQGYLVDDDDVVRVIGEFRDALPGSFVFDGRERQHLTDTTFVMLWGFTEQDFVSGHDSAKRQWRSTVPIKWSEKYSGISEKYLRIAQRPTARQTGQIDQLDFDARFAFTGSPKNRVEVTIQEVDTFYYGTVEAGGTGFKIKLVDEDGVPVRSREMVVKNDGDEILVGTKSFVRAKEDIGCLAASGEGEKYWRSSDDDTYLMTYGARGNEAKWASRAGEVSIDGWIYNLKPNQYAFVFDTIETDKWGEGEASDEDRLRIIEVLDSDCGRVHFHAPSLNPSLNFNTTLTRVN